MANDEASPAVSFSLRAAAYARMSRASQDHSIQYQLDAIQRYASANGMAIVRTFVDAGLSGLKMDNRPGLLSLLAEVASEHCAFSVVLAYDVSRWGRFQDVDESAFYEHLCRRNGVTVQYCAETFADDGTPMSALLKSVKRIMAAEYSRELGVKVLAAQTRLSRLGYKQGGRAGYALRRVSVAASGERRTPLGEGERKTSVTDRVTLVHGPEDEVAVVRRIFQLYVEQGLSDRRIAALLRREETRCAPGKCWSSVMVRRILTNPRYCGELRYNRTTRRMGSSIQPNPPADWISCATALLPMVEHAIFDQAQQIRLGRAEGPQREEVLRQLRAIYQRHGTINIALCRGDPVLPNGAVIIGLFGGYLRAYAAAGLPPLRTAQGRLHCRTGRLLTLEIVNAVMDCAARAGGRAEITARRNVLLLNGAVTARIAVAACGQDGTGRPRWRVPLRAAMPVDFVLCGLMDHANRGVERYLLLAPGRYAQDAMFLLERRFARVNGSWFDRLEHAFGLQTGAMHKFRFELDPGMRAI